MEFNRNYLKSWSKAGFYSCLFLCLFLLSEQSFSNSNPSEEFFSEVSSTTVFFWAVLPNPNDYTLFANGGWDGNWVVGFDSGWVVKLSSPSVSGNFSRAFLGARLGRAKVESEQSAEGKPTGWKKPVKGEINIAVSNAPNWKKSDVFLLTPAEDIPVEGDSELPLEETGESRWFWVEAPLSKINFAGDNYLAIWSPSPTLQNNCPIIAGGWEIPPTARSWLVGDSQRPAQGWITSGFQGKIPQELTTAISVYTPALAIKLIPEHLPDLKVNIESVVADSQIPNKFTFVTSIEGNDVAQAYLEISSDNKVWQRYGRGIYRAPFIFTLRAEELSEEFLKQNLFVRIKAVNWWEDVAYSPTVQLAIVPK